MQSLTKNGGKKKNQQSTGQNILIEQFRYWTSYSPRFLINLPRISPLVLTPLTNANHQSLHTTKFKK